MLAKIKICLDIVFKGFGFRNSLFEGVNDFGNIYKRILFNMQVHTNYC